MSAVSTACLFVFSVVLVLKVATAQPPADALSYALSASMDTSQELHGLNLGGATPSGTFSGVLKRDSITSTTWYIEWTVSFQGLTTGLTAAHIHTGAPTISGGVIVNFNAFGASGTTAGSGLSGTTGPITASALNAIVASTSGASVVYVNLHTAQNPAGEIRGALTSMLSAIGDPHFVGYDGTKFDFNGWNGGVFNLMSERNHQINSRFSSYGPNVYNGTWMTGFGLRYADQMALEVQLDIPDASKFTFFTQEGTDIDRMTFGDGDQLHKFLSVKLNNKTGNGLLASGDSLLLQEVMLHFPPANAKHAADPFDGPVVVVKTPKMEVVVYLETEGVVHLDLSIRFTTGNISATHGVIGQTLSWITRKQPSIDGEDADYHVKDGLLGTDFTYNMFGHNKRQGRSVFEPDNAVYATSMAGLAAGGRHCMQ